VHSFARFREGFTFTPAPFDSRQIAGQLSDFQAYSQADCLLSATSTSPSAKETGSPIWNTSMTAFKPLFALANRASRRFSNRRTIGVPRGGWTAQTYGGENLAAQF